MRHPKWRFVSIALAVSLTWSSGLHAGDLNAEINTMFNNMGGVSNYTAPGAFRGQTMNTYSGGSLMGRIPNKRYQLAAFDPPSISAGCNGISINGGSISLMNTDMFVDVLKNFGSAMKGVAFQLALKSVSPLFGGITEWFKELESKLSISSKSSCELATMAAGQLGKLTGYSTDEACKDIAKGLGLVDNDVEAAQRCNTNRKEVLDAGRASGDASIAAMVPFAGNLTWAALAKGNSANLDNGDRELIMSMIGTAIYDEDGQVSGSFQPTITTVSQLLYGEAPSTGQPDQVLITLLKCDEPTDCKTVTPTQVSITSLSQKVRNTMLSIVQHIRDKQAFGLNSDEVAFVNVVSEPVYRMLAIATSTRDDSPAQSLIGRYGDVIAADFAIGMLSRTVRVGIHALSINSKLSPAQVKDAQNLQSAAQGMLGLLAQEKTTLYAKVGAVESMTRELERLQTTLRTNSPAKVLSLLGDRVSDAN